MGKLKYKNADLCRAICESGAELALGVNRLQFPARLQTAAVDVNKQGSLLYKSSH